MQVLRIGYPAEHAALHLDRGNRGFVVPDICSADAILQKQAPISDIIRLPHDGMNANVGSDAA